MVADWTKIVAFNNSFNRESKKFSDPKFHRRLRSWMATSWFRSMSLGQFFSFAEVHAFIPPVHAHLLPDGFIRIRHFGFTHQPVGRWAHSSITCDVGVVSRRHFMK